MRYYMDMHATIHTRYAVFDDSNRLLARDLHPERAWKTAKRLADESQERVWLVGDDESEREVMPG